MNKTICFGTCLDVSDVTEEKQQLWMQNDLTTFSESIISYRDKEELLVINFQPEDEKILVENHIATISLHSLFRFVYGEPVEYDVMLDIIQKRYKISIGDSQCDCVAKLLAYKSVASKISAFISDCIDIINKKNMEQAFWTEVWIVPVLWHMSGNGYFMDTKRIKKIKDNITMQSENISNLFYKSYGCHFLNYFGDNLKAIVTREDILKLDSKLRIISKIEKDVVITHFNSIGTRTYRITTTNANVQGFPKEVRKCLLPRIGDCLVEYDLTSSQFFILACLADESSLISKYANGEDIYLACTHLILDIPVNEIKKEERAVIKRAILLFINGAGGIQLQKEFGKIIPYITENEARGLMEKLFENFPKVKAFIKKSRQMKKFTLPNGREIVAEDSNCMLAYVLQGIESDILKKTLISIYERINKIQGVGIFLCIHDAIILDEKDCCKGTTKIIVEECFKKAINSYFPRISYVQIKEDIIC